MRSVYLFLLAFIFIVPSTIGQAVIIQSEPGNCPSCVRTVSYLNVNKYPVYIIFDSKEQVFASEIEKQYGFIRQGIKVVFDNDLYQLTRVKASAMPRLVLLDEFKNVVFNVELSDIDSAFVSLKIDSYFANLKLKNPASNMEGVVVNKNDLYLFHYGFGILKKYQNNTLTSKFTSESLKVEDRVEYLNTKDSLDVQLALKFLTPENGFSSKYKSFKLDPITQVKYFLYTDLHLIPTDTSRFYNMDYIVSIDSLDQVKMYNFKSPDNYYLTGSDFVKIDDSSFVFYFYNYNIEEQIQKDINVKMPHMAVYRLSKNQLIFSHFLDIDLPYLNKKSFKHDYITMFTWAYPYTNSSFSNDIINVNTGEKATVLDSVEYSQMATNILGSYGVKCMAYNHTDNQFFCFYKLNGNLMYNVYDLKLNILKSKIKIPPSLKNATTILWSKEDSKIIFVLDDNSKIISLPVELFS